MEVINILCYSVRPNINIFAVYVGLTASGYNLAHFSSDEPIHDVIRSIIDSQWSQRVLDYFQEAQTKTCEVNPYWPRAFLLALSSLYFSGPPGYKYMSPRQVTKHIENLDMINPADKQADTINWLMELPEVYAIIRSQPVFDKIWSLFLRTLNISQYEKETSEAISSIVEQVGVTLSQLPRIIIVPNPLQAPQVTDSVTVNGGVYVIKAQPDTSSIAHEVLHQLFGPGLEACRKTISVFHHFLAPVRDEMIRWQYAWDDDILSWNRVFEENLMRAAEIWIGYQGNPSAAGEAADFQASPGFIYVPIILRHLMTKWSGLKDFTSFVEECLRACEKGYVETEFFGRRAQGTAPTGFLK